MKVLPDSPAGLNGSIKEGDLITAVAEANAAPVSLEDVEFIGQAVAMIRGPQGSVVRLSVVPGATNTAQTKVVSVVRGELHVPLVGLSLEALTKGDPAPDAQLVRLPGKRKERLSDHRGKIVVLEFWATWCGPCLKLMPETQKHAERLAAKEDVLWITASLDGDPDVATARLRREGWDKTRNTWAESSVAEAFGVGSLPRMYVISPQGRIVYQGYPLDAEALGRLFKENDG
jgi:thiol-disulfide isomerase/thioredoxin